MHNTSLRTQLIWSCVAAILIGFFLPWAKAELREPKLFGKISSGMKRSLNQSAGRSARKAGSTPKTSGLATIPTKMSGFQIPILANRHQAKTALALVKVFTKKDEYLEAKSWGVYVVPALALLCGWLMTIYQQKRPILLAVGVVCAAIAVGGTWRLLTLDTKSMLGIGICSGLWLTLAGYAGLAGAALWPLQTQRAAASPG
ncbi:MAG: hypothetical protein COV75_09090 [Candidatus Omnitrophica bacterium CG11_big_fil_rev_8_21_14_0_20_63_9]|nr:MAG: hypothetical protein COV75_09090 [Candidatus Omnitrophica bacterium CG11_big_fil_rev_8_21_14_0_20_63_9]